MLKFLLIETMDSKYHRLTASFVGKQSVSIESIFSGKENTTRTSLADVVCWNNRGRCCCDARLTQLTKRVINTNGSAIIYAGTLIRGNARADKPAG